MAVFLAAPIQAAPIQAAPIQAAPIQAAYTRFQAKNYFISSYLTILTKILVDKTL